MEQGTNCSLSVLSSVVVITHLWFLHWNVVAVKFEMLGFRSALAAVWTVQLWSVCQGQDVTFEIALCENQSSWERVKRPMSGPATQCISNQKSPFNERSETEMR